ncbi:MAG: DUF4955 domain-containing protein [Cyclobacteriaceae bacterium]
MKSNHYSLFFLLLLVLSNEGFTQEAEIWNRYIGSSHDESIPVLPDYSFAGYNLGEEAIPDEVDYPVFDITNYGAIANDTISDQAAIQAAIDAAVENGSGVVFFPPGEFWVITDPLKTSPITIQGSNIILRGSGALKGGTIINMRNHMLLPEGESPWGTPSLFEFSPTYFLRRTYLAKTAHRGDYVLNVENASIFQGQKYCELKLNSNLDAAKDYLDGKQTRDVWNTINTKGIDLVEYHEIESVDLESNQITLKDPLVDDLKLDHGWLVGAVRMLEKCGFEDIHVEANFLDKFVHHKNYIHDYAWHAVSMGKVAHSWVRRCRFSNVTLAAKMNSSYSSSLIMLLVDGNGGHALTSVAGGSTRVLQGLIWDNTNDGQWHGTDMSGRTCGSVVWRVDASHSRGFDLHASYSRTNLIDLYTSSGLSGQGGHFNNLPHHLAGLTIWNQKREGSSISDYNFWSDCGRNYCGLTVVNPIVVGYHGSATTFLSTNLKYEESNGTKVSPESLYEAQLEHRLTKTPEWLENAKDEWTKLKGIWYSFPTALDFNNVSDSSISISWQDNADFENGYKAQISNEESFFREVELGESVTSYTFVDLEPETEYVIHVVAFDDNYSLQSDNISVSTLEKREEEKVVLNVTTPIQEISVYPNPSNGKINVEFVNPMMTDLNLAIYDIAGKLVKEQMVKQGASATRVDLNEQISGVYFLKIEALNAIEVLILQ